MTRGDPYNGNGDGSVMKLTGVGVPVWSTYVGGDAADNGGEIIVDTEGNIYLTGDTESAGWVSSGFDTTYNGGGDALVVKLSGTGSHVWSTYPGGTSSHNHGGIAVDSTGNMYAPGGTTSANWVSGGFDTTYNGGPDGGDAFVVRLTGTGTHVWSTSLGGTGSDEAHGAAVDGAYGVCVACDANSTDLSGGFDATCNGYQDGFVAKITDSADTAPPKPNPSTWLTEPYATESTSIRMVATATSDPNGVECYFDETSGNPEGTDSGGQDGSTYEDTGLPPSTEYTYHVKARDKSANHNETSSSAARSATTSSNGATSPLFDIAVTSQSEGSISAAFDGTNFLVGIQGAADALYNVGAQRLSPDGSLLGNLISTGRTGSSPFVAFGGGNYLRVWTDDATPDDDIYGQHLGSEERLQGTARSIAWGTGGQIGCGLSYGAGKYLCVTTDHFEEATADVVGKFLTPGGSDGPSRAVCRFWSPVYSRHFYTISETERDKLINNYSHIWTYERVAYSAVEDDSQPDAAPIYRFRSGTLNTRFCTMSDSEKTKLVNNYPHVWTYERVAFYAYADGLQPQGATAVYRLWSSSLGCHFYTMSRTERDKLISLYPHVSAYEGISWFAYE